MNNFDDIIKQKVGQFEVPFNEAHWALMDAKLSAIRTVKIRNRVLICTALISIIATSSYFIFSDNSATIKATPISTKTLTQLFPKTIETIPSKEINITRPIDLNSSTIPEKKKPFQQNIERLQVKKETLSIAKKDKGLRTIKTERSENETKLVATAMTAEFIVYNNQVCLGEAVNFEPLENKLPVSYSWDFGDGSSSHERNPSHTYKDSQVYTISLTLIDKKTGQKKITTQKDVVTIIENPEVDFSFSETSLIHDKNKLKYPYTTFLSSHISKENSYYWDYGNGEYSTASVGKTIYKEPGEYSTTLVVKNNTTGCSSSQDLTVNIENGYDMFAPNAFTPNNNGGNETFIPKALLGWNIQFEMVILNNFGKIIFTSSDKNNPWNGRLNNKGQLLPAGNYLWQLTTFDSEKAPHRHHGKITLVK
jgi:gliding motility-associated-like protein